jgi:hypothetical protein
MAQFNYCAWSFYFGGFLLLFLNPAESTAINVYWITTAVVFSFNLISFQMKKMDFAGDPHACVCVCVWQYMQVLLIHISVQCSMLRESSSLI